MWRSPRLILLPMVVLGALVALSLTGCGGRAEMTAAAGRVVAVNERDFAISVRHRVVPAGPFLFEARNHGPDLHELIIVRTRTGRLPLRSDGLTVNEEAVERATVAALEPAGAGSVRELRVNLAPGRYVFFCNMAGHFMAGMHTTVVVR